MEVIGKIIEILPAQTGTSARGEWKRQDFILETNAQFPKKICMANWGDKIDLTIDPSKTVKVYFDVESREYNVKWYTDIKPWKIDIIENQENSDMPTPPKNDAADSAPWDTEPDGDMPF